MLSRWWSLKVRAKRKSYESKSRPYSHIQNKTGLSIKKFLESPYAGKHPKLISKGTKAVAAEAAVTAAEAIAVEEALAQKAEPGHPCASAGSHTSGSACPRPARSTARKS
jgi:hypothetical protein